MIIETNESIQIGDIVKHNDKICLVSYIPDYQKGEYPFALIDLNTGYKTLAWSKLEAIPCTLILRNAEAKLTRR